jgi:hypothetical protein
MLNHSKEGPPCAHMEKVLNSVADGSAKGIRRWYALAHAARCHHCGTFLGRLEVTLDALKEAKQGPLDPAAMSRLQEKIVKLEQA